MRTQAALTLLLGILVGGYATHLAYTQRVHRLRWAAEHDPLTGMPNRGAFDQCTAAAPPGDLAVVVLVDLDGFKQVNDTFGHDVGDLVLQAVAGRLGAVTSEHAKAFRLGGDEFAIILALGRIPADHATELACAYGVTVHDAIVGPWQLPADVADRCGRSHIHIRASLGVTAGPCDWFAPLLRAADVAAYQSKTWDDTSTGRRVTYCAPPPVVAGTRPAARLRDTSRREARRRAAAS